jgi:very-short-patch-repair endonuclease
VRVTFRRHAVQKLAAFLGVRTAAGMHVGPERRVRHILHQAIGFENRYGRTKQMKFSRPWHKEPFTMFVQTMPTDILEKCRTVCLNGVDMYSVYDALGAAYGLESTRNCTKIFTRLQKRYELPRVMYKFAGRRQRDTPIASAAQCMDIIRLSFAGSRIPLDERREILQDPEYIPVQTYSEVEIHSNVAKALRHTCVVMQHSVGPYRVDMYLPEYRIAVECDEYGHPAYNQEDDATRQAYITEALQCTWIRYDPYDADFDIFKLIGDIVERIMASRST